ncbi:helix-turn-helix transcriptional regulator [Erwiniaceae bacterium BAC15a-03b]|uniref:Helix-turn-helix transcriptional regulator n=1 Tax=Winslowiella arboricola TaxID=2978220 RepID=A0A9J6PTT8_9GAMM|nr:helix-turn-helix domain-containing protein [Winslowiella arboricola]MCU5773215.1 helix-turn-helix transcriptional regulator [Winslowiella arboricola]MCU5779101.1 helix-turn-helix transcriptional regulator [Winslowiella arboricola]
MPVMVNGKMMFYADSEPRRLMELFSVKWTTMVIHALYHWPGGKCRTGELQRSLDGISKKMLVQSLREVERRGLVTRNVFNVVPPKVEYELTALGRTFAEPIELMYQWGQDNKAALDAMEASYQASDEAAGGENAAPAKLCNP